MRTRHKSRGRGRAVRACGPRNTPWLVGDSLTVGDATRCGASRRGILFESLFEQ